MDIIETESGRPMVAGVPRTMDLYRRARTSPARCPGRWNDARAVGSTTSAPSVGVGPAHFEEDWHARGAKHVRRTGYHRQAACHLVGPRHTTGLMPARSIMVCPHHRHDSRCDAADTDGRVIAELLDQRAPQNLAERESARDAAPHDRRQRAEIVARRGGRAAVTASTPRRYCSG